MEFVVINGPNLGFLGQRQPEIYGAAGMDALPGMVERLLGDDAARIRLTQFQSNSEGALIDRLEEAWKVKSDGIVLNAGAYTHTSLALADCLAWIRIPCVEVHLSNVHARQSAMRHTSLIARHCIGAIAGFGIMSYALAVQALWQRLTQP
ncbi:3-dehydroquinate dehydratase [Desulfomicrobium sp. ZS1]|uniref:type II 3-dehydroquinate dehydratase n=1 Tax=Desulfomicrobium sp. ZS1 TaxID=2952228 RepID=UPI0020B1C683|nr:type II 3-dehydroquinate dehydratase [Desulfomicrobium sp. ZS1]UTF49361.1 3-dehydroquinate dehydratase [Desulfomicrobium sp. ZS1]